MIDFGEVRDPEFVRKVEAVELECAADLKVDRTMPVLLDRHSEEVLERYNNDSVRYSTLFVERLRNFHGRVGARVLRA